MKKVFIGLPSYSSEIPIAMSELLSKIKEAHGSNNIIIKYRIGMPVHKARNMLVEDFLTTDCELLLMIDTDNPITVEGFDRLVESMDGKHIVCGAITSRKRTGAGKYCIAVTDEVVNDSGFIQPKERYTMPANQRLVKVDNCGTGCVMYSREVIYKAFQKYLTIYEFDTKRYIISDKIVDGKRTGEITSVPVLILDEKMYYPTQSEHGIFLQELDIEKVPQTHYKAQPFGEDLLAHRRMKSLGYEIYLDTTVIGEHIISWNESTTITHDMYSGLVLSIVVPVYNNKKFIRSLRVHILETVTVPYEVIFVDDCSSEKSGVREELASIGNQNMRIIHHQENACTNAARMTGIQAAKGRFVWVINDDVVWEKGLPELMIDKVNDNNLIVCPVSTVGESEFQGDRVVNKQNICGRCWMCNRDDFVSKIGAIPSALKLWFGDDWVYHRVLEDLKKNIYITNEKLCHHYGSQTVGNGTEEKPINPSIGAIIQKDRQERIRILLDKGWTDTRFNIIKGVLS